MNDLRAGAGFKQFAGKHIMAIDYGEKVTGVATFKVGSDPYPVPFDKIIFQSKEQLVRSMAEIINDECVDILVIGVPYLLDGQSTSMTKKISQFVSFARQELEPLPVYEQDETLSSFEAEKRMLNSPQYNFKIDPKKIDALAASIILEDFIKTGVKTVL